MKQETMTSRIFICSQCGSHFKKPHVYAEVWGEHFCCCPVCKGDAQPALACPQCGKYWPEDSYNYGLCPACAEKADRKWQKFQSGLSGEEKDYYAFSGVDLS